MDKEQEVLALVAGYARFEVDDLERLIDDSEVHQATCADIRRMAELLASRSSSDEQRAEVVGWSWELRTSARVGGDGWPEWNWEPQLTKFEPPAKADVRNVRPLCVSPSPAVAAGGVTEEMVRAAEAAVYPRHERGFLVKPLIDPIDMRAALLAALAVRDEGMREGAAEPFLTGRGWENLSCDDQFALATRIAANIGYELVAEAEHPDSPHNCAHAVSTPILKGEGE